MLQLCRFFVCFNFCFCLPLLLFDFLTLFLFSKPTCGSDIKARFVINYTKIVPRAVKQASVLERVKSTCFHILFVCQAGSRCSKGIVIFQTGTQVNDLCHGLGYAKT